MTINDVLPLKAARRHAIANSECFRAADTKDLISMVTFTFTMRRHFFGSHQRHLFLPVWQRLVGFGFCVQRVGSTMQNLRRVGENYDPILSRLWTKVHEIFRRCRKPLVLSNIFFQLSVLRFVHRYSPLSLEVVEKRRKCKSFMAPNFCGRDGSDFSSAVC